MAAERSLNGLKILVIDDDEFIRATLRTLLKRRGCQVLEASDGNAGIAIFRESAPDVVITDIVMPDKEGLETISEIQALQPRARIIAMSGGAARNQAFLQLAQTVGAGRILTKPFTPEEVVYALESLLND